MIIIYNNLYIICGVFGLFWADFSIFRPLFYPVFSMLCAIGGRPALF